MAVDFVTIVACGGRAERLGGEKARRVLAGVPLIDRAIAIARGFGAPIALATGPDDDFADCGLPVLADERPGLGPMAPLMSGFAFARGQGMSHVLMLGCDQPFLPADLAGRLSDAVGDAGVAVPVAGGFGQTMAALWRADLAAAERYVADGGRSLWRFADAIGRIDVAWPDAPADRDPFADIDDPAAFARAEVRLRA